ncbi:aquaporin TIP4-1-like isoform X3 [Cucurbita pepo subsp. pepo]|uniref:Aquaporin TIP4-1 n=1 Tax=Cucurbita moschata TaxID=3662 RepID=A0A6J1GJ94_CUCMO|nr:aquaporin TIP4-1 [Cucurbita moschata]XP_023521924.1 aquaporin TIP4-1-like [Cucurbita pepo subsp. pepo]XP_023538108.1 aquaporin TIP4-1-like isoform X1 [Cucurbita pepo subsp. pepo]XP_023538109.1 aquaporin TIP4-1-like isoform X2 [Cucurbita pepo subsp. pepo]XP_023538110.1 aquaporin TIP4-1-like isoform X3 [Cucurbita pepo subsp. pepo]
MAKIALGCVGEATQPDCIRALVVEFITTFLFVFVGVGSAITANTLLGNALVGLFSVAVAHALVVAVMISAGHISGGHLNPAVTLGLLFGGHITVVRSALYWIIQLLAASAASFLLSYLTGGSAIPVHTLASGVGYLQGVIWEIILTFSLLFTVYATMVDPKKGALDGLGPMLTGFVVGANILAGGAFSGASMNPARSFGPALVAGDWTDHWVYWVGPLIGGGLAGFIYENFFIERSHVPLPRAEAEY